MYVQGRRRLRPLRPARWHRQVSGTATAGFPLGACATPFLSVEEICSRHLLKNCKADLIQDYGNRGERGSINHTAQLGFIVSGQGEREESY